jgi:hypothetical protein
MNNILNDSNNPVDDDELNNYHLELKKRLNHPVIT